MANLVPEVAGWAFDHIGRLQMTWTSTPPYRTCMRENVMVRDMHRRAVGERRCIIPVDASSQDLLRSHCRGGNLLSPFPHMFADPEYWATLTRAERYQHILRSLCLRHPDWIICGPSAAMACGFSESHRLLLQVHVIDIGKNRRQPQSDHIRFHFRSLTAKRTIDGIRVSPLIDMLLGGTLIAGELDGRQKYVDTAMLKGGDTIDAVLREKNRDGSLSLLGIRTVHFTFAEVFSGTMVRKLTYAGVPQLGHPRPELLWHPR